MDASDSSLSYPSPSDRTARRPALLSALVLSTSLLTLAVSAHSSDTSSAKRTTRPLRVAIRGSACVSNHISALTYDATFQAQTLIYETLVKRDAQGSIVPGLASSWTFENGGREVLFTLRPGAMWHDGSPVTAADVRIHFKRWVGLPEHDWLFASHRIQNVIAESTNTLRVVMDQPYALLPDLCNIRPAGIGGPGCLDREGNWVKPVGSGPFRFVELRENGRVFRVRRVRPPGTPVRPNDVLDLLAFNADTTEEWVAFAAFRRGDVDILIDGWKTRIPREEICSLKRNPKLQLLEAPGSVLHYISFRLAGPTSDINLRRHIVAAIDRRELIDRVEGGYADVTDAWAAPTVKSWPQVPVARPDQPLPRLITPLRLLGYRFRHRPREEQLCTLVANQLRHHGIPVTWELKADEDYRKAVDAGEYDLRTETTWGVPYDPDLSLKARFLPLPTLRPAAVRDRYYGVDDRLRGVIELIASTPDERNRLPLYAQAQQLMSENALVAPLYVPRRVAVLRHARADLPLDHDVYRNALEALTDR